MPADITIARVYESDRLPGRYRLLVDRLWPRGVSRAALGHDVWIKEVAPSDGLRRWFHSAPGRWEAFCTRYRTELRLNPDAVGRCLAWCKKGPVTLLYAARDRESNHAVVLRAHLIEVLTAP